MFYQLKTVPAESYSAWGKAPSDIARVAERLGAQSLDARRYRHELKLSSKIQRMIWFYRCLKCFGMRAHSVCLLQHPFARGLDWLERFENWFMLNVFRLYHIRLIFIVHDIGHWRKMIVSDGFGNETAYLMKYADRLIVHNTAMRKRLAAEGVPEDKMIEIGLFDYLVTEYCPEMNVEDFRQVIIAGNLRPDKVPYLQWLASISDVDWHLYGKQFDDRILGAPNIHYEGCYSSEEVPLHLRNGFGLVWDGASIDGCTGNTGEYLRYNNPHKLSLYLSSGLPVIVWEHAATASFVRERNVGLVIGSLRELGEALAGISVEKYRALRLNALKLSSELRGGRFTEKAISHALLGLMPTVE